MPVRTLLGLAAALALPAAPAAARQAPPRLIVAVSIDQFSADLFNAYRPTFAGGLKRLSDGIVYANGYQAHAATETCPGHSTILTGARPARNGIVANTWYDPSLAREDKAVYCSEDETVPGTTSRAYTVSDRHLRVDTLGDRLKARDPRSRTVAVAGKDRAAVMMGGHRVDQRWYWKGDKFVSTATAAPPQSVARLNAAMAAALAQPRPPLDLPDHCRARDVAIPLGGGKSVGTHRLGRAAGDARAALASPEVDAATLALAASLAAEMGLGRGPQTDVLAIGLSGTDYVGHSYGTGGVEMCLQLATLDADLGAFFEVMDRSGVDYAVVMTADHGGLDLPERARLNGTPDAARIDPAITPTGLGRRIAAELGLSEPVLAGDYYVAAGVPADRRAAVIAAGRRLLVAHPQVHSVYTKDQIAPLPLPIARPEAWSIPDKLRASFDPVRSGDLMVVLKDNITPIADPTAGYVATHGSVWDHDRKVPIAFWWRGIAREDRPESAETVDILPTVAGLVRLPLDRATIDGRCLALTAATCR